MRTTLTVDDDILEAARNLAAQQGRTIGEIISELARKALNQTPVLSERNGIKLLPISRPGARVTLEMVNALRDEVA